MSFHVKDDFAPGTPVAAVGADWYNKVGGFINALVGGCGISLHKPERPSVGAPVMVDIDVDALRTMLESRGEGEKKELFKSVECDPIPEEETDLDKDWNRGDLDKEKKLPVGAAFQVVSRIVSIGGMAYRFYLRDMEVDSTGRIRSISKETGYFEVTAGY